VEIVISGRNVEVPEAFRDLATEKLDRLGRYDHKIVRLSVELAHEPNPRQSKSCQCVQITGHGRGPVVRGEGCAADFLSAFDLALGRLEARLRRAHDRRRVHHGRKEPVSVARALAGPPGAVATLDAPPAHAAPAARRPPDDAPDDPADDLDADLADYAADYAAGYTDEYLDANTDGHTDDERDRPGRIVRRKEHHAVPMRVDDALSEMELVGHDFFLFSDAATGRPSVVYRRRGYDYGVIALVERGV